MAMVPSSSALTEASLPPTSPSPRLPPSHSQNGVRAPPMMTTSSVFMGNASNQPFMSLTIPSGRRLSGGVMTLKIHRPSAGCPNTQGGRSLRSLRPRAEVERS